MNLVTYEYVSKPMMGAGVNFRWAFTDDGRFLKGQNPRGIMRPQGEPVWWFHAPMQEQKVLTPDELAGVRAIVARCDLASEVVRSSKPSAGGDWRRLTVHGPAGPVVYEVEDGASQRQEAFMGELLALLMPQVAAATAQ